MSLSLGCFICQSFDKAQYECFAMPLKPVVGRFSGTRRGIRFDNLKIYAVAFVAGLLVAWIYWQRIPAANVSNRHAVNREHYHKLGASLGTLDCQTTELMRVCSHKARTPPDLGAPSGSLAAYALLWQQGIHCFDLDYVITADYQLIAVHPADLLSAISEPTATTQEQIESLTLDEIRERGADAGTFPTLQSQLKLLSQLLHADGHQTATDPQLALLMELKGRAFPGSLEVAVKAVDEANMTEHTAIWVSSTEQLSNVRQARWKGPIIWAYRDADDPHPRMFDTTDVDYIGPSISMDDDWFDEVGRLDGKPMYTWVVDLPSELKSALHYKSEAIISNVPLKIQDILNEWRDVCMYNKNR